MDLSKFNINPNAKARIRERFFKRRLKKVPEITTTVDRETEKIVLEKQLPEPESQNDVLFAENDEGFPMITSVFSLAAAPDTEQASSTSSTEIPSAASTTAPPLPVNDGDFLPTTTTMLPFVVQSPDGVITVCSQPHTSVCDATGFVGTMADDHQASLTSEIPFFQSSTETITEEDTVVEHSEVLQSKCNQAAVTSSSQVTHEDPSTSNRPSDFTTHEGYEDSESYSTLSGNEIPPEDESDGGLTKSSTDVTIVTQHDDRIRRLKDLLRKQEDELEKLRFKRKSEVLDSPSTSSSNPSIVSGDDLRKRALNNSAGKFVRGNELRSESPKQGGSTTSTQSQMSPKIPIDPKGLALKRPSTETTVGDGLSPKRLAITQNEQQQNLKMCKDNYRLVNVTIVKGHTRTLAVPIKQNNQPKTVVRIMPKQTSTKEAGTSIGTLKKAADVSKQLTIAPKGNALVHASKQTVVAKQNTGKNTKGLGQTTSRTLVVSPRILKPGRGKAKSTEVKTAVQKVSTSVPSSTNITSNKSCALTSNIKTTTRAATSNTSNETVTVLKKLLMSSTHGNSSGGCTTAATTVAPTPTSPQSRLHKVPIPTSEMLQSRLNQVTVLNSDGSLYRTIPPTDTATRTPLINAASAVNTATQANATLVNASSLLNSRVSLLTIPTTNTSRAEYLSAMLTLGKSNNVQLVGNTSFNRAANTTASTNNGTVNKGQHAPRQLHAIAPKPASATAPISNGTNKQVVVYSIPTQAAANGSTNNLENRPIIVCNVMQSNAPANQGKILLSPMKTDNGNVLVYVTNKPGNPNVGVVNANATSNSEKVPATVAATQEKKQENIVTDEDCPDEFIPNGEDTNFTSMVGLEQVVQSLISR